MPARRPCPPGVRARRPCPASALDVRARPASVPGVRARRPCPASALDVRARPASVPGVRARPAFVLDVCARRRHPTSVPDRLGAGPDRGAHARAVPDGAYGQIGIGSSASDHRLDSATWHVPARVTCAP
ncbi:hypothetical protein J4573_41215 [Actinomadura barringtoniae]|uniref:Uncharacterized protein n=1 Tax=Actinomadura barringtoniae TaxID=1427535 RepID=A0A939PK21_9ACTN|nr:hypothetical protein [Actinomadura barringtoniae]MBO2453568.1 hypothetical protein [Actinomadura barringtoniae]